MAAAAGVTPADIEAIERATLDAVPPSAREEWPGWIAALDRGTISRASSAVPLSHEPPADAGALIARVEAVYRGAALAPMLRVPRLPAWSGVREALAARGYTTLKPTLLMLGDLARAARMPHSTASVELLQRPDAGWASVFLGEGFDPVDGASRVEVLGRSSRSVFARATVDGQVAAVGAICLSPQWCGIHGMRTAPAFRQRGLAGHLIGALARHAQQQGWQRIFLQVEENNSPAQSLYGRAGFTPGWAYEYWRAG